MIMIMAYYDYEATIIEEKPYLFVSHIETTVVSKTPDISENIDLESFFFYLGSL